MKTLGLGGTNKQAALNRRKKRPKDWVPVAAAIHKGAHGRLAAKLNGSEEDTAALALRELNDPRASREQALARTGRYSRGGYEDLSN